MKARYTSCGCDESGPLRETGGAQETPAALRADPALLHHYVGVGLRG